MADQEKQLDHLLDSLLANYADAEPRPGFETRLRAALREPKPSFRFGWLWAGAAAIVMAVTVFAVYYSRLTELPPAPRIATTAPPVLPPTNAMDVQGTSQRTKKWHVQTPEQAPNADLRPEVFPTPVALSEQEHLLLRYLAATPRDEVASHAREDEPAEKSDPFVPESQRINGAEVFSTR
ncbi:MAG TPA: hypothetical protein VI685_23685 [Candidatus Angelobacter sp.]